MDMIPRPNHPQTLAWEPLDSLHTLACARVAVLSIDHILAPKQKWFDQLAGLEPWGAKYMAPRPCCREKGNLDIEAWYSLPADQEKGIPDIYKIHCNACGNCHVKYCVGGNHPESAKYTFQERPELFDIRPKWEVR